MKVDMHMLKPISIAIALLLFLAMPVRAEGAPWCAFKSNGAPIAATIPGNNARRALTAMTIAPAILGTAQLANPDWQASLIAPGQGGIMRVWTQSQKPLVRR